MQYTVKYFIFWNTLVKTLLWRTLWRTPSLGTSIPFETILRREAGFDFYYIARMFASLAKFVLSADIRQRN
jgi:hypothetical protein